MHRFLLPALILTVAAGCEPGPDRFGGADVDTLFTDARGVELTDDSQAFVGMNDVHCEVFTRSGSVGADYYEVDGNDAVVASMGDVVAIIGNDGLYVDDKLDWNEPFDPVIASSSLVDGGLWDGGAVGVSSNDGLVVDWAGDITLSNRIPAASAPTSTTVDPVTGATFLATDGDVLVVDPGSVTDIGDGDLVAYDASSGVLYTASLGGLQLTGLEVDGNVRFTTGFDAGISLVATRGATGEGIVVTDAAELFFVDGATGTVLDSLTLPDTPTAVTSSPSGDTLALTYDGQVRFLHL